MKTSSNMPGKRLVMVQKRMVAPTEPVVLTADEQQLLDAYRKAKAAATLASDDQDAWDAYQEACREMTLVFDNHTRDAFQLKRWEKDGT